MPKFVSNQNCIYKLLENALADKAKFSVIKGPSGSGKTYLIEALHELMPDVSFYRLSGDRFDCSRPYYPFRNCLNDVYTTERKKLNKKLSGEVIKNTLNQAGSISPLGADFLSTCITELTGFTKKKHELYNIAFNKDEIELLFPLDYFCGGSETVIFLADDLQYWDNNSLQLLYTLVRQQNNPDTFLKNALIVATINTSIKPLSILLQGLEEEAKHRIYRLEHIALQQYRETMLTLGCMVELSDELVSALYSITDGNLQLTADIVLLLQNSSDIEGTVRQVVSKRNLGHLIVDRLNKSRNDGSLVNDALKFGSLFGNSFYYHDLEFVLNLEESRIRNLIDTAQDYSLVKEMQSGASFIHELIRETYQREADDNKAKYYIGFSNCLKLLHPGDYFARAESLYSAGQYKEAFIIYLLNYIKGLRSHTASDNYPLPNDLPVRFGDYITALEAAYCAFDEGNYQQCLEILEGIEDIYPSPLLAEKYYLLSITLSKWLDTRLRLRAQVCLEPYLDLENVDSETEVWERVLSAYIVACVHNNNIESAQEYEKRLNESITTRIDFDLEASFKLNTLRRKASSLHSPAVAFQSVRKSKDFFAPRSKTEDVGAPLDPVEYYMSLNNYVAVALMAGKATDVFREAEILIRLPLTYRYLRFPRYEMPLNNSVLVAFLNESINAKEAEHSLKSILKKCTTENTTAVIIQVNIAIFTALQGNFDLAREQLELLLSEASKISNLEYYYSYLIRVNLAAILYVSNQASACIKLLEDISSDPLFLFDEFLEMHASSLLALCRMDLQGDKECWYRETLPLPDSLKNTSRSESWHYYGNRFLFGELEFWSES